MTPKEKATELVDKFFLLHESATDEKGNWTICIINKGLSKKCALIAVNEIIENDKKNYGMDGFVVNYWQEVRNEINNL